ncbi:NAD+ synthase [Advenella faeciporci]|uniref:Glutamine-dependent NAD(+) synthetase n=1 Tax=Advenella faeciporci TaxID=797535 RepID=A0A918JFE6_9BURK|nr:NAD+ synthase [Advenella faeciporci]GGW77708.1 NAD+ synthase [Advenella faeciporci]
MEAPILIGLAQINATVGRFADNAALILQAAQKAYEHGVDVLVLPELALVGYQPEDLLLRPEFIKEQASEFEKLCARLAGLTNLHILIGHVVKTAKGIHNCVSLVVNGKIEGVYFKQELPNYSVFDEKRYFTAGTEPFVFTLKGHCFGVAICEDTWLPNVPQQAAQAGAQTLLVLNASPYTMNKDDQRIEVMQKNICEHDMAVVYCNMAGGQDELVFDGNSFVLDAQGQLIQELNTFVQALGVVKLKEKTLTAEQALPLALPQDGNSLPFHGVLKNNAEPLESEIWRALVLATQDYLGKNFFKKALLGLSGGIDSAVVLAVAVDAIGAQNVQAVMMPSEYTADISVTDSQDMAQRLGISYHEVAIASMFETYLNALSPIFANVPVDTTEENLQARIRGTLLMAISNKFGSVVLTTGNKSELATGYCTLYGDMVGGFAILKDLPKTWVYRLAKWRNTITAVIPERIITRPPSAELRPDQTDQDSLPEYDILDGIIERMMEQDQSSEEIIAAGYARQEVEKVARLLRINEYKRRQGAPGPKLTRRAFGRDWRYPITNGYHF